MSKNPPMAVAMRPADLNWVSNSINRENSKRVSNSNGGPDRTRTYDPALIKRML